MVKTKTKVQFRNDFPELSTLCRILDKALADEKYYTQWFLDQVSTIEYDTKYKNLIVSFDKRFLQTFKNKILLDIDKYSPSAEFELEYFDKELRYKVYESVFADRNIVKIAFKASPWDFKALNTLAWYVYSKYNFGPLHHKDKRDVKTKGLRFKVRNPQKYGGIGLKEWAVEKIPDSYYDETDKVFYKEYEHDNVSSNEYLADIEWHNKFRYRPQFYKRFAPENCHFNKENLIRAIMKKIARMAEEDGYRTILKDNGVAILTLRKKSNSAKVKYIVEYKNGRLYYWGYTKKCPKGGSMFVKKPIPLSMGQLWEDYDLDDYTKVYEILGLF